MFGQRRIDRSSGHHTLLCYLWFGDLVRYGAGSSRYEHGKHAARQNNDNSGHETSDLAVNVDLASRIHRAL
jgi:hypothetical protein